MRAFYRLRSEREQEQLDYNLPFRWFVGRSSHEPVWNAMLLRKNRDRPLNDDIAAKFFVNALSLPQVKGLLSSEHFSFDDTLILVPKSGGGPPSRDR